MSIDEETRPIGTRPRIGTVSTSHFQVQIDGIHHSRSTSRRKTVREARVRTAAIVERDATNGRGVASPGSSPSSVCLPGALASPGVLKDLAKYETPETYLSKVCR